ncbi:hypothetical protein FF38_09260 [Lucilia cuprina]|uniref:Uncharacterized protein n=1 Tax=Lucilia cuprina TaxID=7375 RepID=A0A0L0C6B7_LUCCU|nr:hypothetical protein FF38_09260 [Lucilia cuprina]
MKFYCSYNNYNGRNCKEIYKNNIQISQQNKCNTSRRQQQPFPQQQPNFHQHQQDKQNYQSTTFHKNNSPSFSIPKPRYKQHKELIYTSSSISNASSTDDEYYRQRQKYNLAKQTYEKAKISKSQLGSRKSLDSHSSTSDYQSSAFETAEELYRDIKGNYKQEDQKAKAQYKVAKPGGIRNYTPKILSEVSLSTSAPEANGFSKQKSKVKDDPWI